jgi:hypothetical protein
LCSILLLQCALSLRWILWLHHLVSLIVVTFASLHCSISSLLIFLHSSWPSLWFLFHGYLTKSCLNLLLWFITTLQWKIDGLWFSFVSTLLVKTFHDMTFRFIYFLSLCLCKLFIGDVNNLHHEEVKPWKLKKKIGFCFACNIQIICPHSLRNQCRGIPCFLDQSFCVFTQNLCHNLNFQLTTKGRACKVMGQEEARRSHLMLLKVQKSVREWTFTLPSELPFWELESQWTPEFLEGDCKGQNPLDWRVLYTIEKLLKLRCLKWVRMTHLDIWNTS